MPKLPETIGKYKITGRLGKGGMSILYLAEHPSLGTRVVLKKLTLKGDSSHRERFRREATLMMKLRHDNVVGVYDHFKVGSSHYLVMEYVDGRPLSELMAREGALPEGEVRWLAVQVAGALAHIHSRGIVHRDLKPSNILLGRDGSVKLGDFGIAFTPGGDDDITSEGTALGTPTFMAPEQLEDARGADERSDMWSFGVCLFEMLTGRKFVTGPSPAAVREALPAAVKSMSYRLPSNLPGMYRRLLKRTLRMKSGSRLKDGQAALRLLKAGQLPDKIPESLQRRLNGLMVSIEGRVEPTPKAEASIPVNEDVSSLKKLFNSPGKDKMDFTNPGKNPDAESVRKRSIRSIKNKFFLRNRISPVVTVLSISILLILAVALIFPEAGNSIFRRNSYGILKLELVFPPDSPEHWFQSASAVIYREKGTSLEELRTPELRISGKSEALVSRKISLPSGAYRIMWSLGDRVSWYSFRLGSIAENRKSGTKMQILRETLDNPPAFPLKLSWQASEAVNGIDISDNTEISWERIDSPGGELTSGGTYRFSFSSPGYLETVFDIEVNPWRRSLDLHASLWPQPGLLSILNKSGRLVMPRLNGSGLYLDMRGRPESHRIGRLQPGASVLLYLLPGEYSLSPGLGKDAAKTISLQSGDELRITVESGENKEFVLRTSPGNL